MHESKVLAHWMRSRTETKDAQPTVCAGPGACAMTQKEKQPTKCGAPCDVQQRQLQCQQKETQPTKCGAQCDVQQRQLQCQHEYLAKA